MVDPHLVRRLQRGVGERLASAIKTAEDEGRKISVGDERQLTRTLLAEELESLAERAFRESRQPLSEAEERIVIRQVMDRLHGLGRIQPMLEDPRITNIEINGHDAVFITYTDGVTVPSEPVADSDEELKDLITKAARRFGLSEKRWDDATVKLDLQLPGGDRLHAIRGVTDRPAVTIRRHNWDLSSLKQLQDLGLSDRVLTELMRAAVKGKLNLVVAGGTNTGKTTLLRALINEIPPEERLVTVEDNRELGVKRFPELHPNVVEMESRPPNIEGEGEITLATLLIEVLRMNPGRVIVGEIRGGEMEGMLKAMSQGNDGSMCSIHANSASSALGRLAVYANEAGYDLEAANLRIAEAIDLIIHIGWVGQVRRITSVIELTGRLEQDGRLIAYNTVFKPAADGRAVPNPGRIQTSTLQRLVAAGFDSMLMEKPDGWWET